MANPFYVSPLGGLNVGQSIQNMGSQWQQNEIMDMRRTQFEQGQQDRESAMQKQSMLKDLASKAVSGDLTASQQLWVEAPEYAAQIDKGLSIQNEQQAQQVGGWLEQYLTTPTDQRDAFLQKTASQTPFSIDDDLLAMDPAQRDGYANMLAGRYLNKEQLAMLQGSAVEKPTTAQADFNYYQELQKRDPAAAEAFGMAKGYVQTGREAAPTTAQRDWKEYQRLKKEDPVAAKQYAQAVGFITKEGRELSAHLQKRLSAFTDEAAESSANEIKYNDLAEQIIQAGDEIGSGFFEAGWGEKLKEFTGDSDWKTQLRRDVQQIKVSEGIKNLPQGPATDKDIELVMKPFPPDTASAEYIASYLRGLAKLSNYRKQYNDFKANYVSENGTERGMLKAWKEEGITPELSQREEGFIEAQAQIRNVGRFQVQEVK